MNHPDFRLRGKIFATLGYPAGDWGMVKLSPEEQQNYVSAAPEAFEPAKGVWGCRGATMVRLKAAKKTLVRKAMVTAVGLMVEATAPKGQTKKRRAVE